MNPSPSMESFLDGLIKKFNEVPDTSKYDKKKTMSEFVLPLFSGLGWEFEGKNPSVIDVSTISKDRADYSFEIDGITKFVLKIAPLDENIDDKKWIIPVTTFAFNKGITWAIVTNFKKIKVLNSEVKGKTPLQMQFFEIVFDEFISKYDRLAYLLKKSFELDIIDKEAEYFSKKQKKTPIDVQLLEDLLKYSNKLSYDIQKNNSKKLSIEEIDESVHKILNRLIFIRACGDRGLEQKHLISNLREWEETKDEKLIRYLRKIFDYFEENYGGTIFSDHLCDKLEVSNSTLQEIIEGLYISEDKSIQYDFSIIESDILGQMYEQYLRYFRTTDNTNIETERKKQGIFYTPGFVVDYIVKNTLGELVKDKKIDHTKIRILDPACGSGSFLIKAYDFLYHYNIRKDSDFHQTRLSSEIEGGVYSKKVQILKENLFGVDLDKIATEVIQLNLLLKITEKRHHLPILQQNIRLGNSVVNDPKIDSFALKWDDEFHQILKNEGGFDLIIGNPPYVRQEKLGKIKPYLKEKYQTYAGTADLFVYFFEKSIELLKKEGYLGFIVSNKWLKSSYGKKLRQFISEYWIEEVIDFGDTQIFKGATTYPCIVILKKIKKRNTKIKICKIDNSKILRFTNYVNSNFFYYDQNNLNSNEWNFANIKNIKLLEKINSKSIKLKEYLNLKAYSGVKTGLNKAFIINEKTYREILKKDPNSKKIIKPMLTGKEIRRYYIEHKKNYLIFTKHGINIEKYPAIEEYLNQFKNELTPKIKLSKKIGRKPGDYKWYEIQDSVAYHNEFEKPKIIFGDIVVSPRFTMDENNFFTNTRGSIIPKYDKKLLGILNSKLGWYFIKIFCTQVQGGYFLAWAYIKKMPISTKKSEKLEELVDTILSLQKILNQNIQQKEKDVQMRKNIEEQITKIDSEINNEVYGLYDLTSDEIEIIESEIKQ
ncbi:MAG: N-6 DNA methylase [Nitrosarchaeum sp.]